MKRLLAASLALCALFAACNPLQPDPTPDPDPDPTPTPSPAPVVDPETDEYRYLLYGVAEIDIETDGHAKVDSKDPADYRPCSVSVSGSLTDKDGGKHDCTFEGEGAIRGRGNSTWEWYAKKPYRIKLNESQPFMGMKSNSDWVLLADYRDITHMMNNVGFSLAHHLDLPYTNHIRYAELTLNGEYMGLYAVTEQVEKGGHRVDVEGEGGILLALDVNDGPGDCPYATDNFYSEVYGTDCCVKYPSDPTASELSYVKAEFAKLESVIRSLDWDAIQEALDVQSMIDYLMIQEIICNVEMNNGESIRSGYINRKPGGKWYMGPLWDCDGGFCYNWGDMYDSRGWGHTYFEDYRRLIFGSDPYTQKGAYGGFPGYFSDLFGIPEFVKAFKARWNDQKDSMEEYLLENLEAVEKAIASSAQDDLETWGISNYVHKTEYRNLVKWLENRFDYLDGVFNAYPENAGQPSEDKWTTDAEIVKSFTYSSSFALDGHYEGETIFLDEDDMDAAADALGADNFESLVYAIWEDEAGFCAVEPDGDLNPNNTANAPGHWFAADGYVTDWGHGYVFSELGTGWNGEVSFSLGKHPDNCTPGNYSISQAVVKGKKAVKFTFNIEVTE